MQVKEAMHQNAEWVDPDTTVSELAETMRNLVHAQTARVDVLRVQAELAAAHGDREASHAAFREVIALHESLPDYDLMSPAYLAAKAALDEA